MFNKIEYMKQYNIERKEHYKKYYQENKEERKEYNKQWRERNKKRMAEYNLKYMKKYYEEYAEKIKMAVRAYKRTEKGKLCKQRSKIKRKAKIKDITNTLTAEEWIEILKEYKFKCAYCGKEFTLFDRETKDHVIPISKGGNNTKENIVPACRSCNSKKHNKIIYEGGNSR